MLFFKKHGAFSTEMSLHSPYEMDSKHQRCFVFFGCFGGKASLISTGHATSELPMMLISADRWGIQPDLILLRGGDFLAWSKEFLQTFGPKNCLENLWRSFPWTEPSLSSAVGINL